MQIENLQSVLKAVVRDANKRRSDGAVSPKDRAYYEGKLDLGMTILNYTNKIQEAMQMEGLVINRGNSFDTLPQRVRVPGEMEVTILNEAKNMKAGEWIEIDTTKFSAGGFSQKVHELKTKGKLPETFGIMKHTTEDKKVRMFFLRKRQVARTGRNKAGTEVAA